LPRGQESRSVRALRRPPGEGCRQGGRPSQGLSAGGEGVRGAVDLWETRVRHLLSHQRQGCDEVQHQGERRGVQGAEGRAGLRGAASELLRGVHRRRLCLARRAAAARRLSRFLDGSSTCFAGSRGARPDERARGGGPAREVAGRGFPAGGDAVGDRVAGASSRPATTTHSWPIVATWTRSGVL